MHSKFYGWPTHALENEHLRLEFLSTAGPRLVRLSLTGSDDNLLGELPEMQTATPYGTFRMYGGHRLWHAPEAFPRTYAADNDGLTFEKFPGGARLTGPVEAESGIQKQVEIRLDADRPGLTLDHTLTNHNPWPVELAPWGITALPLNGWLILPQPAGPLDEKGLLPNRQLVLWPYSRWSDARLHLGDDFILVQALSQLPPLKIGHMNRHGWIGYLRKGVLFRKRFSPQPDRPHVDFGCNAECYCSDQFIEMETVGPLTRLEPGLVATHREDWELIPGLGQPRTADEVRQLVAGLSG